MKARKAAIAGMLAGSVLLGHVEAFSQRAAASEEHPETALSVSTAVADWDGNFTAVVSLDEIPDTGLGALDFAISYDPAALSMDSVKLLYDTGAQKAEKLAYPDLDEKVFTYEISEGQVQIRWLTVLSDPDYWLREEQAFISISGKVSAGTLPGSRMPLAITPASRKTQDGSGAVVTPIAAGYLDGETTVSYDVTVSDGAVLTPINEAGATMYGDMDLNGELSVSDAVLLHRAIAEELALSAAAYANADCESDGVLTIADVTLMLKVLSKQLDAAALGAHDSSPTGNAQTHG